MSIVVDNVCKSLGDPPNQILSNITLKIESGEFVALTGRSGSGKSTLLYILSSLDTATSGTVELSGQKISGMSPEMINKFRNEKMGFVFQFNYLIAELNVLENVLMPASRGGRQSTYHKNAMALLDQFGLTDKHQRFPRQLSGGEQQRVAIARALVMTPDFLFADEPTGSLDSVNGDIVMKILQTTNTLKKTTVILVTHDADFAKLAPRQIHLADGKIVP